MAEVAPEVKKKQLQRVTDYKFIFKTTEGRRVLYDLMRAHNVMQTTYVANDPIAMAIREGERNAVLRILTILKMNPRQMERFIEAANDE